MNRPTKPIFRQNQFFSKTRWYFDLAYNMQPGATDKRQLCRFRQFAQRPCLHRLGIVINMLIQNRIAGVNISEKIDLGWQLRHFRKNLGSYAAT